MGSWLDALMWVAARAFPRACPSEDRPFFLEDVPHGGERGPGPDWPHTYAASHGAAASPSPAGGLLPDLHQLQGPIDSRTVPDVVRTFYEQTGRFRLAVTSRWRLGTEVLGWVWARLWARRWGQLELPMGPAASLTNELWDTGPGGTVWVRRFRDASGAPTSRALYVSRYDTVVVDGEPRVRICFPVPGGTWVVLFSVRPVPGGIVLTEQDGAPAGFYLVPAEGPARFVRALREEITVVASADGAAAMHTFRWWGLHFLTLSYSLPSAELRSA